MGHVVHVAGQHMSDSVDRVASRCRLDHLAARAGVSPGLYSHSARAGSASGGTIQPRRLDTAVRRYHPETMPLLARTFANTRLPSYQGLRSSHTEITRPYGLPSWLVTHAQQLQNDDQSSIMRTYYGETGHGHWTR